MDADLRQTMGTQNDWDAFWDVADPMQPRCPLPEDIDSEILTVAFADADPQTFDDVKER
jgi:hypothetical protein